MNPVSSDPWMNISTLRMNDPDPVCVVSDRGVPTMYSLPCLLEPSWQIAGVAAGDVARFTLIIFCHLDDSNIKKTDNKT